MTSYPLLANPTAVHKPTYPMPRTDMSGFFKSNSSNQYYDSVSIFTLNIYWLCIKV